MCENLFNPHHNSIHSSTAIWWTLLLILMPWSRSYHYPQSWMNPIHPLRPPFGYPGLTDLLRFWTLSWQGKQTANPKLPLFLRALLWTLLSPQWIQLSFTYLILFKRVVRAPFLVLGDWDSDEGMKEPTLQVVHSPSSCWKCSKPGRTWHVGSLSEKSLEKRQSVQTFFHWAPSHFLFIA